MLRSILYTAMGMAAAVAGADDRDHDSGNVAVLSAGNFTEFLEQNPTTLVEFYAPWCGHCKNLEPHWNAAANILNDKKAKTRIAKVDATIDSALASEHGVQGYPTIKYCVNSKCEEFNGPRERQGIVDWVLKREAPNVKKFRNEQSALEWARKQSEPAVIAYLSSKKAEATYRRLTSQLIDEKEKFGYVLVESPAEEKVVVLRNTVKTDSALPELETDETTIKGLKAFDSVSKLKQITEDSRLPLIGSSRAFSAMTYVYGPKVRNIAVVVLPNGVSTEEERRIAEALRPVAEKYRDLLTFTLALEGEANASSAKEQLGFEGGNEVVIQDRRHGVKDYLRTGAAVKARKYRLANQQDVGDADVVTAFIEEWKANKLPAYLKSQPRSDADKTFSDITNASNVRQLVATDFEGEIYDPKNADKDFFVMYHAPWCGHCKSMKPAFAELAQELKNQPIVVAAMDATANDVPIDNEVQGYPTLVYYPAANTKEKRLRNRVKYQGGRDVKAMLEFVEASSEVFVEGGAKRDEL